MEQENSQAQPVGIKLILAQFTAFALITVFYLIKAHYPISAKSSIPLSSDYSQCIVCLLLYRAYVGVPI